MNSCQCWNWDISIDFTSVALKQTNLYKYEKDDVKNVNRMHSLFRSLKHYYQALTHKHARTHKHTHTFCVTASQWARIEKRRKNSKRLFFGFRCYSLSIYLFSFSWSLLSLSISTNARHKFITIYFISLTNLLLRDSNSIGRFANGKTNFSIVYTHSQFEEAQSASLVSYELTTHEMKKKITFFYILAELKPSYTILTHTHTRTHASMHTLQFVR